MEGGEDLLSVFQSDIYQLQADIESEEDANGVKQKLNAYLDRCLAEESSQSVKRPLKTEFPLGTEWVNVKAPLTVSETLRGKLVILDFFTYCCANCLHILPALKRLESAYPESKGVAVIGVHSAKFSNERDIDNLRAATQRYHITHAVVNDASAEMWQALAVPCWPTLFVLSPGGSVINMFVGESGVDGLRQFVEVAVDYYTIRSLLNCDPIGIEVDATTESNSSGLLNFPGKVCVNEEKDGNGRMLAVSDSGHSVLRMFEKQTGILQYTIGQVGSAGHQDGTYSDAMFDSPQGVCFLRDKLYVADTGNHALRCIDLANHTVSTLVSKETSHGCISPWDVVQSHGCISPWDVVPCRNLGGELPGCLLIAMAGNHQIWAYFLDEGKLWNKAEISGKGEFVLIAGSGQELNKNNSYPLRAGLAQPSGICVSPSSTTAYIADSESSTVRSLSLQDGSVKALVGGSRDPSDLFSYGDIDGIGVDAKLQHPLGVSSYTDTILYVADSFNHKLKVIDTAEKRCTTVECAAAAEPGEDGNLLEPGGLFVSPDEGIVYIANTNRHRIDTYNISSQRLSTLDIHETQEASHLFNQSARSTISINLEPTTVAAPGNIALTVSAVEGYRLKEDLASWCQVFVKDNAGKLVFRHRLSFQETGTVDLTRLTEHQDSPKFHVTAEVLAYFCKDNDSCLRKSVVFFQAVSVDTASNTSVNNVLTFALKIGE